MKKGKTQSVFNVNNGHSSYVGDYIKHNDILICPDTGQKFKYIKTGANSWRLVPITETMKHEGDETGAYEV